MADNGSAGLPPGLARVAANLTALSALLILFFWGYHDFMVMVNSQMEYLREEVHLMREASAQADRLRLEIDNRRAENARKAHEDFRQELKRLEERMKP